MKWASVATDLMVVSGQAMLEAWIAGRAEPAPMTEFAKGRLRSKIPVWAHALTGLLRDHHRRLLATQVAYLDCRDEQIETLGTDMTRCLTELSTAVVSAQPSLPRGAGDGEMPPRSPDTSLTFRGAIALWDTIPGIDRRGRSAGWRKWSSTWPTLAPRPGPE
jgi:hypothetical protein